MGSDGGGHEGVAGVMGPERWWGVERSSGANSGRGEGAMGQERLRKKRLRTT